MERAVPSIEVRTAVGAEDSFLGGTTLAFAQGKSLKAAIACGEAAGTAAVFPLGAELYLKKDVEQLYARLLSNRTKID